MVGNRKQVKRVNLLEHPDFKEIDELIASGVSPLAIQKHFEERYRKQRELIPSLNSLYSYRRKTYPHLSRKTDAEARHKGSQPVRSTAKRFIDEEDISTRIMRLTGREPPPPKPRQPFTDEQLLRWSEESVEGFKSFVEELIIERGQPVKLQPYQLEMAKLMIENTRVCFVTGGQVGKDFMMMCFSLWWAITHPGSQQVVMCATQSQSAALRDRTKAAILASEDLTEAHGYIEATKPDIYLGFVNGAKIYYMTAKSLIAGKTALDIVYVNEARDIKEEEVTRVSPLLGVGETGKLFVLSRPRFRRGYLWDCFTNPAFKTMQIPTEQNKYFSRKVLEDDRRTLSPDLFKIEYLAEFADAGSSYFNEAAIDYCSKEEYESKELIAEEGWEYYLGVDPARLRDTSAMVVIGVNRSKRGEFKKKVVYVHGFSPEYGYGGSQVTQFAHIEMIHNRLGLAGIMIEKTGMGGPYTEYFRQWWRERGYSTAIVKTYDNSSLKAKLALYGEAKRCIENHEVKIPRQESRLISELKLTQFGATARGQVKVETPTTDDYADAFCLALWAARKPFEIGVGVVKRFIGERVL